ncbi:hypothetical protein BASA82_000699 [Batrachochytrium salamandrivorans]|uniref:TRP C-terminal domain-containing protein n=1 Tax=Batrachochytrium salamandrivorans TaxID=1357716 RepID=A0ABQ8FA20_9FUNG|nr:hypothetical protein BASA50_006379 [Batrachochytrium salamandrivorans]KAH9262250.1 hypothetical protein BASA82_000699 [Batrachochytrium salamandrivorans]
MSISAAIGNFIDYAQHLSIISSINIPWPNQLAPVVSAIRYVRIDFATRIGSLSLPPLDFRAQFLLLVDILPLVIAFLLLAVFQPFHVILWYILLLASIGAIIGGSLLLAVPSAATWYDIPAFTTPLLLAMGCIVFTACVGAYLYTYYRKRHIRKLIKVHPEEYSYGDRFILGSRNDEHEHDHKSSDNAGDAVDGDNVDGQSSHDEKGSTSDISTEQRPPLYRNGSNDENMNLTTSEPNLLSIHRKRRFPRQSTWKICLKFFVGLVFIYTGLCTGSFLPQAANFFTITMTVVTLDSLTSSVPTSIGIVLISIGALILIYVSLGCFRKGRVALHKANVFSLVNIGTFIILFLSLTYIPVSTSLLQVFGCTWQTCDSGSEFVVHSLSLDVSSFATELSTTTFNGTACSTCSFNTSTCSIAASLCPGDRDYRLNADQSLSCSSEILPYYGPGAVLMFFVICIGVPYIYYRLTALATKLVRNIPPNPLLAHTPAQIWRLQMQLSTNLCRGLYYGFKFNWRYYSLVSLGQKIAVVAIFVFTVLFPSRLLASVLVIHGSCFLLAVIFRPYDRLVENMLNATCLFLNSLNATISLLIGLNIYSFPSSVLYILASLNLALPVGLMIYLIVVDVKRTRELKKEIKETKLNNPELDELITEIDIQLNAYTIKILVRFFMTVGLASFLSLALTCFGFIHSIAESTTFSSSVPTASTQNTSALYEFAGYTSWSDFTNNCCCEIKMSTFRSSGTLNELWKWKVVMISMDFFIVCQMIAATGSFYTSGESGLAIRGYCSTTFNTTAVCGQPTFNQSHGRYTAPICTTASMDYTSFQKSALW